MPPVHVNPSQPTPRKPHRARGAANPNHGLSEEMVQTLAFDPEAQQAQQQQQQQQRRQQQEQQTPPASPSRLVWTVAPVPKSSVADVLRHRMSDSAVRSREPPKVCMMQGVHVQHTKGHIAAFLVKKIQQQASIADRLTT